ncbi:hypothetical protein [Paenibacillus sp. HB172176]|uniref:hypothetical protein n=1 Tax=Paenibacillus sp. HB172176 TaxID=2493690 RepID=UPI0014387900|nr:hypothetical protein [Paenibacillus sp. HB172176]
MKSMHAPLVVFVGTTPNIGTTTAAFAAAMRMAEASDKPVGYLCLHLKSAKLHRYVGVDEPEMTLDKLQPELKSQALTGHMLLRSMHVLNRQPNLHILFGCLNREYAEYFNPDEIDHLLDVAESLFSVLIVDGGAYWDNAAILCALHRANSRILVTTSALSHFQEDGTRWMKEMSPQFRIQPQDYDCVMTEGSWNVGNYGMNDICKELGVSPLEEFRLGEALLHSLDRGQYQEWLTGDAGGKSAMKKAAQALLRRHGIRESLGREARKRPWFANLIKQRNGAESL